MVRGYIETNKGNILEAIEYYCKCNKCKGFNGRHTVANMKFFNKNQEGIDHYLKVAHREVFFIIIDKSHINITDVKHLWIEES